jgi:hypothetical protein
MKYVSYRWVLTPDINYLHVKHTCLKFTLSPWLYCIAILVHYIRHYGLVIVYVVKLVALPRSKNISKRRHNYRTIAVYATWCTFTMTIWYLGVLIRGWSSLLNLWNIIILYNYDIARLYKGKQCYCDLDIKPINVYIDFNRLYVFISPKTKLYKDFIIQ